MGSRKCQIDRGALFGRYYHYRNSQRHLVYISHFVSVSSCPHYEYENQTASSDVASVDGGVGSSSRRRRGGCIECIGKALKRQQWWRGTLAGGRRTSDLFYTS